MGSGTEWRIPWRNILTYNGLTVNETNKYTRVVSKLRCLSKKQNLPRPLDTLTMTDFIIITFYSSIEIRLYWQEFKRNSNVTR